MTDSRDSFDITVVGGGMVGAAFALAAAQQGFQVLLLERSEPSLDWPEDSYDLRVSALTRASQCILQNLGVWSEMVVQRITAYEAMQVWDQKGLGEIHFDAADLGEPDLGHIVENRTIVSALWQSVSAQDAIDIRIGTELQAIDRDNNQTRLTFADGSCIQTALLVGADGARSQVRELMAIASSGSDYHQHAVVATVRAEQGNSHTAWQHFMPAGPLALLPMDNDLFSIVWSTTPQQAEQLLEMPESEFNQQLTLASESRCGRLTLLGARAIFPLRMQRAESYVKPGVALMGDAAHVIHPLAGQGVNLGLLDAGALIDVLVDARSKRQGLGELGVLRRYERARKGHNLAVQTAMSAFKHLFSNQNPALHLIRNLGLGLADKLPPLRRQFERVALGQGVELPSLGRSGSDD